MEGEQLVPARKQRIFKKFQKKKQKIFQAVTEISSFPQGQKVKRIYSPLLEPFQTHAVF